MLSVSLDRTRASRGASGVLGMKSILLESWARGLHSTGTVFGGRSPMAEKHWRHSMRPFGKTDTASGVSIVNAFSSPLARPHGRSSGRSRSATTHQSSVRVFLPAWQTN